MSRQESAIMSKGVSRETKAAVKLAELVKQQKAASKELAKAQKAYDSVAAKIDKTVFRSTGKAGGGRAAA